MIMRLHKRRDLGIAALPDSSLRARRLCAVPRSLVAAPGYLKRHGRPAHPSDLAQHACLGYAYLPSPEIWRFSDAAGEEASVRPSGPLRANNADALMPALLAGLGLAVQPRFIVDAALAAGRLEAVLPGWSLPPIALRTSRWRAPTTARSTVRSSTGEPTACARAISSAA